MSSSGKLIRQALGGGGCGDGGGSSGGWRGGGDCKQMADKKTALWSAAATGLEADQAIVLTTKRYQNQTSRGNTRTSGIGIVPRNHLLSN